MSSLSLLTTKRLVAASTVLEGPYTTNIGSRLYMPDQRCDNQYKTSNLKSHEFTFTVDDKEILLYLEKASMEKAMKKAMKKAAMKKAAGGPGLTMSGGIWQGC